MGSQSNYHQQQGDQGGLAEMFSLCCRATSGKAIWAGRFLQKLGLYFSTTVRRYALLTPLWFLAIDLPHPLTTSFPSLRT